MVAPGWPTMDQLNTHSPVGRERELAAVQRALENPDERSLGAAIIGPAGAGKTTLFRAILDRTPLRVLACSPSQPESAVPYLALRDLFHTISDQELISLPEVQQGALLRVLLRARSHGTARHETVSAATMGVLDAIARRTPILLAIDDAQWLDPASEAAIAFAIRRLDGTRIRLLVAQRIQAGQADEQASWLGPVLRRVRLGPLSVASIFHILRSNLDHAFPRPALVRITEWSGGNPLYAIEIGRRLLEAEAPIPLAGDVPPAFRDIETALLQRVVRSSADARRTALVVALGGRLPEETVERLCIALGWRYRLQDGASEDAMVIRTMDGQLELAHPLLATGITHDASPAVRRQVHQALAGVVDDPIRRARHLALASRGANEMAAAVAEEAGTRADALGARTIALELFELAAGLTPQADPGAVQRRQALVGAAAFLLGDPDRAERHLATASLGPEAEIAARALVQLADISRYRGRVDDTQRLQREARAAAAGKPLLLAEIALRLDDGPARDLLHARAALRLLAPRGPAALRAQATARLVAARTQLGRPPDPGVLDDAVTLEGFPPPLPIVESANLQRAQLRIFAEDLARARDELMALREVASTHGDEGSQPLIVAQLAYLEIRAGRLQQAQAWAEEHLQLAERTGQTTVRGLALVELGGIAALRGSSREMERRLDEAERIATVGGDPFLLGIIAGNRGLYALSVGDVDAAARELRACRERLRSAGIVDPGVVRFHADHVEALVRLGRLDDARALVDELSALLAGHPRPGAVALLDRGKALLAAARGEEADALAAATSSVDALRTLGAAYELGRSLIVLGVLRRRRREKGLAHAALDEAARLLKEAGAGPWATNARRELDRVGLRPRAPKTLTETERTVASHAAAGLTNREIADLVFLSPRTVEGVLGRAYGKLGIRSRAQLNGALNAEVRAD
jgi:DNA-binding CsgD family transcriptional regulator